MRYLEATVSVAAPPSAVWDVLVDLDRWAEWGPSVRAAELDGRGRRLHVAARGRVTTLVGVTLPFEVTRWVDGECWSWDVAGLPATSHSVRPQGPDRCVLAFGVPWFLAPYLVVCRVAVMRIAELATGG